MMARSESNSPLPPNSGGKFGVIYIAFGKPYLAMAMLSFRSLRASNPTVPACIVTNFSDAHSARLAGWDREMDVWKFVDLPTKENRDVKTSIYIHSPFERTLYIDCDTFVIDDITDAFRFLDFFDLSLRPKEDEVRGGAFASIPILDGTLNVSRCPHWNSGVVAFTKNERVERFFSDWNARFHAMGVERDQASLVEALFRCTCRVLSLDSRWNLSSKDRGEWASSGVKIIHYMSEHDSFITTKILEMSEQAGFGNDAEIHDFFRKKRNQRAKKIGLFKYSIFRIKQAIQLLRHKPHKFIKFV